MIIFLNIFLHVTKVLDIFPFVLDSRLIPRGFPKPWVLCSRARVSTVSIPWYSWYSPTCYTDYRLLYIRGLQGARWSVRFILAMKFSAHSIRLAPPERAIRVILLAILRSATVPTSMPFQWGEYISDPGDVCSMCEGMPIQGIRCETQVIEDLKRTSLICQSPICHSFCFPMSVFTLRWILTVLNIFHFWAWPSFSVPVGTGHLARMALTRRSSSACELITKMIMTSQSCWWRFCPNVHTSGILSTMDSFNWCSAGRRRRSQGGIYRYIENKNSILQWRRRDIDIGQGEGYNWQVHQNHINQVH